MGIFPFRLNRSRGWEPAAAWAAHVEELAAAGYESIHLYNWRIRPMTGQIAAVERAVLERAVRLRGGAQGLSSGEAKCYREAVAWLDALGGDDMPAGCRGGSGAGSTCRAARYVLQ